MTDSSAPVGTTGERLARRWIAVCEDCRTRLSAYGECSACDGAPLDESANVIQGLLAAIHYIDGLFTPSPAKITEPIRRAIAHIATPAAPVADAGRQKQTNCEQEPAYPGHETAVFSVRFPDLTSHLPTARCSEQEPHEIAGCGEFRVGRQDADAEWLERLADDLETGDITQAMRTEYLRRIAARLRTEPPRCTCWLAAEPAAIAQYGLHHESCPLSRTAPPVAEPSAPREWDFEDAATAAIDWLEFGDEYDRDHAQVVLGLIGAKVRAPVAVAPETAGRALELELWQAEDGDFEGEIIENGQRLAIAIGPHEVAFAALGTVTAHGSFAIHHAIHTALLAALAAPASAQPLEQRGPGPQELLEYERGEQP